MSNIACLILLEGSIPPPDFQQVAANPLRLYSEIGRKMPAKGSWEQEWDWLVLYLAFGIFFI